MKKTMAILIVLLLALCFTACGGKNAGLIGTWQAVDEEENSTYGAYLTFNTDGTMSYGFDLSDIGLGSESATGSVDFAIGDTLGNVLKVKYKVLSDTQMDITAQVLFLKETTTVSYKLAGDALYFDGTNYTRAK